MSEPAVPPAAPPPGVPAPAGTSGERAPAHEMGRARHLEILNEVARIATADLELRPMLQRITDALMRHFGWEFVACVSVDPERDRFVCEAVSTLLPSAIHVGYTRPLGSGVVGQVAAHGRPILLDDVRGEADYVETMPGTLSELCVPVRHGGRTVAILNLESTRLAAFHDQLPLLETVAEQIAGAIASARLLQEVRRRAHLLEMVGELSRDALEAGQLDLLLDRVVHWVVEHFPLAIVSVLMADPERRLFYQTKRAARVPLRVDTGTHWPVERGIVGRAMRTGEAQLVLDVRADPAYFEMNETVTAELVVPIRFRDRILGVLNLEGDSPDVFSPENVVVFRTFADQIAGAIHMAAMNRALEEANERLRQANQRLERLSHTDGLTGIANRRHFDEVLAVEWRRAERAGTPLSVVMLDLDCFKAFNDGLGHQRGDDCLRDVARALRGAVRRAGDLVARYGGEEFVVLLPAMDLRRAEQFAERLRARVEALRVPHPTSTVATVVTASLGVASAVPHRDSGPAVLLAAADDALYRAKRAGRNRVARADVPPRAAPQIDAVPQPTHG